jgi:hypothetical protein
LRLKLEVQKSQRELLPYGGNAFLQIELDGAPIAGSLSIESSSTEPIQLPLCRAVTLQQHVLKLHLAPESNTTLRVYRVQVEVSR